MEGPLASFSPRNRRCVLSGAQIPNRALAKSDASVRGSPPVAATTFSVPLACAAPQVSVFHTGIPVQ